VDRLWLLTWTTYGSWLPGGERGSVTTTTNQFGDTRVRRNSPETDYDGAMDGLHRAARSAMKGNPVRLEAEQARVVSEQLHSTARFRGWTVIA